MKNHFVAAIAKTIVRVQHWFVLIGFKAPALCLFRAEQPSKLDNLFARPACTLAFNGLHQCAIAQEQVVVSKRRNLILRRLIANDVCGLRRWRGRLRTDLPERSRHNALIMNQSGAADEFICALREKTLCSASRNTGS